MMAMLAEWDARRWAIFLAPFIVLLLIGVAWMFMRQTIRTRMRMGKQLRDDPDINEWIVAFNWSRKVLYVPTIIASLVACVIVAFDPPTPGGQVVGGVWLGIFFINFLVDEYEMSVKILLLTVLVLGVSYLWLMLLDWDRQVWRFFAQLGIQIDWKGYLLIAIIFASAVVISWIRGLFYYVAVTPNYLNLQVGPTESGNQVDREDYSTRIDTGDFLERMLGFGRVIITFRDNSKPPMILLVRNIGKVAKRLESIRGKLSLDRYQPSREGSEGAL